MASIRISTAVDTAAFTAFYDVFQQYRSAYEAQPAAWEAAAGAAGRQRESFEQAAASVRRLADSMDDVLDRTRGVEESSRRASGHWAALARNSAALAGHVKTATESLLRWAGITSLIAGVGTLASPFLVGPAVGAARSASLGLGATYGGLQAFRANYGRFGDADAFLGRINEAQTDVAKRLPLSNLGIAADGRDSADVAAEFMEKFKDWVDSVPDDLLANRLEASHYGDVVGLQEAQRYKHASRDEVRGVAANIRRDARAMALDPKAQRQWQDFTDQMKRAGGEIETVFVTRLVALEPGLERLSKAIADAAAVVLAKNGPVSDWLDKLDEGLEWVADEVGKPEFQTGVEDFVRFLGDVGRDLWGLGQRVVAFARWLGVDETKPAAAAPLPLAGLSTVPFVTDKTPLRSFGSRGDIPRAGLPSTPSRQHYPHHTNWWNDDRMRHAYDRLIADGMTPGGAVASIARFAYVESSDDGPGAHNDIGGGHDGIAQWSRERWAKVGGTKSFDDQLDAWAAETQTWDRGGMAKIFGSATEDRDLAMGASFGERSDGYDPSTGRDHYTDRTAAAMPHVRAVVTRPVVSVNKNTGGNPVQTSGGLGAPP